MVALGFGLERVVLRPLIGRPVIAVVMATIGLAAVLRGVATLAFGAGTRAIVMPISDEPIELGPVMLPPVQLVGAAVSIVFLAGFTWFFLKSRIGIAMRAVADSQQVAMAMGINVRRYFALAWAMAGVVSALGGVVWGAMLGVDNQLALVGLKVFPVVILGGLDSIIGAVVGGLIVGIVENLAAGYLDPYVGGGTKDFAPYVLMIAGPDDPARGHLRPPPDRARVMAAALTDPTGALGSHAGRAARGGIDSVRLPPLRALRERVPSAARRVRDACSTANPGSSRPAMPPTWRSIRCRSPNGRWRRSPGCSSSSRR